MGYKLSNTEVSDKILKSYSDLSKTNKDAIKKMKNLILDLNKIDEEVNLTLKLEFLSALDFLTPRFLNSEVKEIAEETMKDDKKRIYDSIKSINTYWDLLLKHNLKIYQN